MPGLFSPVVDFWDTLRRGRVALPQAASIAADRCKPPDSAGYPIRRDQMYFTVRINEMHLAENRQWWSVYDPLVVVVTEFGHGGERVAVPTVIGPGLIQKQAASDRPRFGIILQDTRVTGPHPYRGGDVDISLAFYQVQRVNHARRLLKVVDTLSSSLGNPGDMQAIAKTAGALLEGVEGLLDMSETTYLAGQRISLTTSPLDPFTAGFSALITPPGPEAAQLSVRDRRLEIATADGGRPYRDSDFVLWSVAGTDARGDESQLPFYPLKLDAITALWDGEDGVKRAKANLIAAYQQMRKSPDVTPAEAGRLFDAWLQEFQDEKARLERTRSMATQPEARQTDALTNDLDAAAKRLAL